MFSLFRVLKRWQLDPDLVDFKILTCKTRDCCNQGGHCPQITGNIDIAMEDIEMIEEKQLYKNILHTLKSSHTLFVHKIKVPINQTKYVDDKELNKD